MTTSGALAATVDSNAATSYTSPMKACAPCSFSQSARPSDRVMPVTSWPDCTSCGTSCRPIAPVAPAMKTRIRPLPLAAEIPGHRAKQRPGHHQPQNLYGALDALRDLAHAHTALHGPDT